MAKPNTSTQFLCIVIGIIIGVVACGAIALVSSIKAPSQISVPAQNQSNQTTLTNQSNFLIITKSANITNYTTIDNHSYQIFKSAINESTYISLKCAQNQKCEYDICQNWGDCYSENKYYYPNASDVVFGSFQAACEIQIKQINLSTGQASNITNSTLVKLITNESKVSCS